jgi:cytochrome P450
MISATYQWLKRPQQFLLDCHREYGDIFTVKMFTGQPMITVFLGDAEAVKQVFTTLAPKFVTGEINKQFTLTSTLGPNSLLLIDGPNHTRQRKLLSPTFHGEPIKQFSNLMREYTHEAIDSWQVGDTISIIKEMESISLGLMIQSLFGSGMKDNAPEIIRITREALSIPALYLYVPFLRVNLGWLNGWGRFLKHRAKLHNLVMEELKRRRANPRTPPLDVLDMLTSVRNEEDAPFTDEEIRDECIELIFAGYATTSSSLAWAVGSILRAPEVLQKLQEEYEQVVGNQNLTFDLVSKLPYLEATLRESLRLNVLFPMLTRKVIEPVNIKGYDLPVGTLVSPSPLLVHYSPKIYPEPEKFLPERYLNETKNQPWIPYGGGPRRCIGMSFAQLEMKIILATLFSRVKLELLPNQSFVPKWGEPTLIPPTGVQVRILSKNSRSAAVSSAAV